MRQHVISIDDATVKGEPLAVAPDFENSRSTVVLFFAPSTTTARCKDWAKFFSLYDKAHVIGMSTSGNISMEGLTDDLTVVTFLHFEMASVRASYALVGEDMSAQQSGRLLASQSQGPDLAGVIVFFDGLSGIGPKLIEGFTERLAKPWGFQVTGAAAGRVGGEEASWVYFNGRCRPSAAVALAFYGPSMVFAAGIDFGWKSRGLWMTITSVADDGTIETINGRPALKAYTRHMPAEDAANVEDVSWRYPIFIVPHSLTQSRFLRGVTHVDREKQTVGVFGNPPTGSVVQMSSTSPDDLLMAAENAAREAQNYHQLYAAPPSDPMEFPGFLLMLSCKGRKRILGSRGVEERDKVVAQFPKMLGMSGFYSYGELTADFHTGAEFHTHALALVYLAECDDTIIMQMDEED